MKTVVLIDLSGLWRASWHATQDLELGAAYTKTIEGVRRMAEGYELAAVCVDCPPYTRREIFPEYKAQREKPTEQMVEQFRRVKERLTADGFLLWGVQGYEADDIIATATKAALRSGLNVMIASSDKDLLQLVEDGDEAAEVPGVRCVSWATGQVFDSKGVAEKFGVPPAMMGDFLALQGDKSDNIPGIELVGPTTAAKLLGQFGTFDDVLTFADRIKKDKLRENVLKGAAAARKARELVTLKTDAPIQFSDLFEKREPKKMNPQITDGEFDEVDEPSGAQNRAPSEPPPPAENPPASAEQPRPGPSGDAVVIRPQPQSQSLATRPEPPKEWALQLEPNTTRDAWIMAVKLQDSRLFSAFGTAEAIFAIILRGRSLGIDAVTSLANFHVIEGKPTMHASLIVGLVLKSGKAEYFELVESTDDQATWATKRKGGRREITMTFSVRDALNAGLMSGTPEDARGVPSRTGKPSNWDKYRKTMMRWRAATELARAVYPDITTGVFSPDELSDGTHDVRIEQKYSEAAA